MKRVKARAVFWLVAAVCLMAVCIGAPGAQDELLIKHYTVIQDGKEDILCDFHVVQKTDYAYRLFRERGELAERDFSEFVRIFSRLNPHVTSLDKMEPGTRILIPLKKISKEALPGQATGKVDISFVRVINEPTDRQIEALEWTAHTVQPGDWVSRLVSRRFGPVGSEDYKTAMAAFWGLNPHIRDLDRIVVGDTLRLPARTLSAGGGDGRKGQEGSVLSRLASLLEASLQDRGISYLVHSRGKPLPLDFSRFPMLRMADGVRLIFAGRDDTESPIDVEKAGASLPSDVRLIPFSKKEPIEDLLDTVSRNLHPGAEPNDESKRMVRLEDPVVSMTLACRWVFPSRTGRICILPAGDAPAALPEAIRGYALSRGVKIKSVDTASESGPKKRPGSASAPESIVAGDPRGCLSGALDALSISYNTNVPVSFPYAGVQVEAFCDIATAPDGRHLIIDNGSLGGEAAPAIEKTGLRVLVIPPGLSCLERIRLAADALGLSPERNPTFHLDAGRSGYGVSVTVPGLRIATDSGACLFTEKALPSLVEAYFSETGHRVHRLAAGSFGRVEMITERGEGSE